RFRYRGPAHRDRGQPPSRDGVPSFKIQRGPSFALPRGCTGNPAGRSLLARSRGGSAPPAAGSLSFTFSIHSSGPVTDRALSCPETVMADYYTHFSCLLDVGTPENAARALELYNALAD